MSGTLEAVRAIVASEFGVSVDDLRGRSRRHAIIRPRQVVISVLRGLGWSRSRVSHELRISLDAVTDSVSTLAAYAARDTELREAIDRVRHRSLAVFIEESKQTIGAPEAIKGFISRVDGHGNAWCALVIDKDGNSHLWHEAGVSIGHATRALLSKTAGIHERYGKNAPDTDQGGI